MLPLANDLDGDNEIHGAGTPGTSFRATTMPHARLFLPLAALLLTLSVAAQRTWIVDAQGRPDADFVILPPAVAAAAAGDTILVRANGGMLYSSTHVDKGIVIRGIGGAPHLTDGMLITNVPEGETFVLDNFIIDWVHGSEPAIQARDNEGTVVLERIVDPTYTAHAGTLYVDRCKLFIARGCDQSNRTAPIRFSRSSVFLVDCKYHGTIGPIPTLLCEDADVHLSNCFVRGGEGTLLLPNCQRYVDPGAGIVCTRGCTFTIGKDCHIEGGTMTICPVRANSVENLGLNLIDPMVTLVGAIGGTGTTREITTAHPGEGVLGATLEVRTVGPEGGSMALFASLSAARPPVVLPSGAVWLDPGLIVQVDSGPVPPGTRTRTAMIPLPQGSLPPNLPLLFQAVSLDRFGRIALSGPAITTIE